MRALPILRNSGSTSTKTLAQKRTALRRLILILTSLVLGLILAEIGLRLAGFSYFNPYIVDRDLGFTLRPNAEGWWTKEGLAYIKINSDGLRDVEHSFKKPDNTIRIAVLGDSFSEALQVSIENTFWSVMQRQLQPSLGARGKNVEVLNFGVSGFSTARELIMLRKHVWQYNPDVVILLITPGNDIKDNSSALTGYEEGLPYFVYQNGSLKLDDSLLRARSESYTFRLQESFPGKAWDWIRARSRVLGLIYTVRESYSGGNSKVRRTVRSADERGIDGNIFRSPVNADWDDAWQVTEKLIMQMRDEVKERGAAFLVATATNGIQVDPDQELRVEYMRSLGVTTLFYPELRIKDLGEREKIDVLNLAPPFLDFAVRNQTFLHGFGERKGKGHWNEAGHLLAGQLLAERLLERLSEKR
jgi:hypothetical protein